MSKTLWAVSDLHAAVRGNQDFLNELRPSSSQDWLIVAGDVAERTDLIISTLAQLRERYEKVIWAPGNHELFATSKDDFQGKKKYERLVQLCREIDVLTPEDPYAVFGGVTVAPLFTLYDYSFRIRGLSVEKALAQAYEKQLVLNDEYAIAAFENIRDWCWERLTYSSKRLSAIKGPTILVNHWPLVVEPVKALRYPEIGLWCGTRHTRSWPQRYNAQAVIYGHLHIPQELELNGVKHVEVSLGYPREWQRRGQPIPWPYPVMEA